MKKKYHHGNLKEALLEYALVILRQKGIKGLSLRALARGVGVSEAAPYKHFSSKEVLLEALATKGFEKLRYEIDAAIVSHERLLRTDQIALGYVNFAIKNVDVFRLMFGHEIANLSPSEERARAGQSSFEPIQHAIHDALEKENPCNLNNEFATLGAWSLVHGIATLIIDNKIKVSTDLSVREKQVLEMIKPFSLGIYQKLRDT